MTIKGRTAQDIQDSIRTLIKTHYYHAGDYLPSVRDLAEQLGVNRNTVAAAYKNLVALGVVVSRGRLGTQIKLQDLSRPAEGFQSPSHNYIDLAHGNPKRELLPSFATINPSQFNHLLYGENIYHPQLLQITQSTIFADLPQSFQIEFTNGAVDAIERLLSAYLVSSDYVAVEQPGFITSLTAIEHQQYKMHAFTVSEQGFNLAELQHALENNAQAIIITPRSHNPTGYSLNQSQAQRIYKILEDFPQVLVIIDDHFSLLSQVPYQHVIPTSTQHWAVIRSVSKYLSPDLRFAFVACDQGTSEKLHRKLNAGSTWVSQVIQNIVYQLLNASDFNTCLATAKRYYQQQNQQLVQYLQQFNIPCASQYDGLNIWLALPHAEKISKILKQRGWLVRSGQDFKVNQEISGLRISPSAMTTAQMQDFCHQLQQIYSVLMEQ